MGFKVLKSGGESTGSAEGYKLLQAEVQRQVEQGYQVVLVMSAPAQKGDRRENRVTELLRTTSQGTDRRERISELFASIADPLDLHFNRVQLDASLRSARTLDDYLYLGEHLQAQQFARFINAEWVDAREVLVIDDTSGNGKVLRMNSSPFETGKPIYVVGGFYGRSKEGNTIVLPKGGSDLTADVLAASLKAVENVNLKEVRGIFAADPRIVPDAEVVRRLTYREVRELAYGGNTVLQEEAMAWCRKAGIPMHVRSLLEPDDLGTRIVRKRNRLAQGIVGIAAKPDFMIYTVKREESSSFFQELLFLFASEGVSVDMIGTENGLVSLAIEDRELAKGKEIDTLLDKKYTLEKRENQALISVVGEGITGPLTLQERIVERLQNTIGEEEPIPVSARYGPILGGRVPSTTIYYIEKFGMNSIRGIAEKIMRCFMDKQTPVMGISTTIDSISIGTSLHADSSSIRRMCTYLGDQIKPDTLSVTRNGVQRHGRYKVPSNITVAVHQDRMQEAVQRLYAEFF